MHIDHFTSDVLQSVDDCEHVIIQIGINKTMVRTAPLLCTNSRFFALKTPCTEINDRQHGVYQTTYMGNFFFWSLKNVGLKYNVCIFMLNM